MTVLASMRGLVSTCLLLTTFAMPSSAFAWGERGHDLVTRAAVRVLLARLGKDHRLAPLLAKEHMLGHLANVPDIVWRSAAKDVVAANAPTHYFDLEYVAPTPTFAALPQTIPVLTALVLHLCATRPAGYVCPGTDVMPADASLVGTAPFRVAQLQALTLRGFGRAKAAAPDGKDFTAAVSDTLLAAGLLSHFVGDLGQPYHATRDYDGYATGQGGIHAYFESAVVDAYDLSLDEEVYLAALNGRQFERVAALIPAGGPTAGPAPLSVALALTLDSFARLGETARLDRQYALIAPSHTDHGLKLKAQRRPAAEAAPYFHDLVVERLATAADTLAHLWLAAWTAAGRPDLSQYQDFSFLTAPPFVAPDYLGEAGPKPLGQPTAAPL